MVSEWVPVATLTTGGFRQWHCVNCGEIVDAVILRNRLFCGRARSPYAKPSPVRL